MTETLTAPEQRTIDVDVSSLDTRGRTLHGYAAVYDVLSDDLGGFRERIARGAFADVLGGDVRALLNHDPNTVLGRTKAGTLRLYDEERGLRFELDLPASPIGENVRAAVGRGDIDGASFRFVVGNEEWDGDVRTVTKVRELHDVTVATYGAYPSASVKLRTRTPADRRAVETTTETETPEPEAPEPEAPEPEQRTGGLRVEDRAATAERPVEDRVREAMLDVRKGESRALTTSSTLAPGELSSFLFDKLRSASAALASGMQVLATERDTVTYPRLTADVAPGWYAEAATITAGDPTLDSITATPRKLAHLVQFSNEVIEDSDPPALDVVRDNLIAALGLKLDLGIYEGTGTAPEIRGLKNVAGIGSVSMGVNGAVLSNLDPFADALAAVELANGVPAAIVFHPRVWASVRKLKDTQNRPLVGSGSGAPPRTIFGVPVLISSQLSITETQGTSTDCASAYVYDPSHCYLVRRSDVEIELSCEPRSALEQDARLLPARRCGVNGRALDAEQVVERERRHERCLPCPRGSRMRSSCSGPKAARAIRRWNGSSRSPIRSQKDSNGLRADADNARDRRGHRAHEIRAQLPAHLGLVRVEQAGAIELEHPNLVVRHLELRYCPDPDEPKVFTRHLRVLAADAPRLHGLTPSLAIVDELHAHSSDQVYVALRTAMLKRPGSRLIVISTAGAGTDTPLGRLRARAFALPKVRRRGVVTDARGPALRMLVWAVPEDADVEDARVVKKANPASWISVEALREQRTAVPGLGFERYHCNRWTAREGHWLAPGAWQACEGEPAFRDGEPIWIGVDVGGERAATAVVWISEALHVGCWIGHGDEAVLEAVDLVRELASRYQLRAVFDPWRFGQAAAELERERVPVLAFPQTDARMIPASARLHAAIVEQRLTVPRDPELRQHVAAAVARHSRRGWRLDKVARSDNIDACVAMCMALERAEFKLEPVELLGWL